MNEKRDHIQQLTEHFFKHSYAKTVAVLVRYFGLEEIEIAEDIVQDTLAEAIEKWRSHYIPDNREGWLMDVAKKKTINLLRRNQLLRDKVLPKLESNHIAWDEIEFTEHFISDSSLRMIFACCHPSLPDTSQIALALKTLCGMSVTEIASALLTNEATINKRLYRAKEKFRNQVIKFEVPDKNELSERLSTVFLTLYLLFNEGYYSRHNESLIRTEICYEAIRLQKQIVRSFPDSAKAKSLLALMLLTFARFNSRMDENGAVIILEEQNRQLWDKSLITQGMDFLHQSIQSREINTYQLQAGIAAEHCVSNSFPETNWKSIYNQYCLLEQMENNVIIKLNKAIARFYCNQKEQALADLLSLKEEREMNENTIYYSTVGKFYSEMNQKEKAILYFETALKHTQSKVEQERIRRNLML